MTRESVEEKARRYLAEGRVAVELADAATVHATARGSDAVYRVGFSGVCCGPARPAGYSRP